MGDLKDMQGFDPNSSMAMDQTIDNGAPMGEIPNFDDQNRQRFEQNNDFGRGMQRSNSLSGGAERPHDNNNLMGGQQQN